MAVLTGGILGFWAPAFSKAIKVNRLGGFRFFGFDVLRPGFEAVAQCHGFVPLVFYTTRLQRLVRSQVERADFASAALVFLDVFFAGEAIGRPDFKAF